MARPVIKLLMSYVPVKRARVNGESLGPQGMRSCTFERVSAFEIAEGLGGAALGQNAVASDLITYVQ